MEKFDNGNTNAVNLSLRAPLDNGYLQIEDAHSGTRMRKHVLYFSSDSLDVSE